ncbi:hypothetical protein BCR39DRAFT_509555 [Naematelia encephala]|uniref:Protein EFR3 n=1 Tax=Naematelia encephala TaxID=71784 RepID=A0A1Y2BKW6_9TREE|nr:hypothetical protein BCR39DRAFT_509555 [Naematelia encephala]
MGCLPCTGLQPEAQLLSDCYPPPKALIASGPDFKPLSSELSKLLYRCTNQSSKLAKVGEELEKRALKESVRSSGGYQKSRASLLISLAILRALITECKRDLALFSRATVRIVYAALDVKVYQKGGPDLEVIGRAASCFSAFATYTDGVSIGVDDDLTKAYLEILRKFSICAGDAGTVGQSGGEKIDYEQRNRTRLIGLAALSGASSSDAMFASNAEFQRQVGIIVPALLGNVFEGPMATLKLETAKLEMDASPSPFFSEFSARRPVNDRRAPSLHAHIPGEKGPTGADVLSAALRSLAALVGQCQVNQASAVLDAVFAFLDRTAWTDVERCCWLAERLAAFTSLQYRFVVPTRLVERLVDLDDRITGAQHTTLLAMTTTVLESPVSLVGLGVADLLANLVALVVRRVRADIHDPLLPALVQSISSLGTHIYYADQINDIVEEIAARMAEIPQSDPARPEILRTLTYCITGVMTTAVTADAQHVNAPTAQQIADKGKATALETPMETPRRPTGRRNPIAPEVWQETLPLLCESKFAVRIAYARALILYIENELPRDKQRSPSPANIFRFCNAVHASIYTLAMSSCLGSGDSDSLAASAQPSPIVPSTAPEESKTDRERSQGEKGVSFNIIEPTPSTTPGTGSGSGTPPKRSSRAARRVSLPLNRINSSGVLSSFDNVATPYDFAAIIKILEELNAAVPAAALYTGAPMLLALDKDAGTELVRRPGDGRQGAWVLERKRAIREVVAIVWRRLGDKRGVKVVEDLANKCLSLLPEPFEVPNLDPAPTGILPAPETAVMFVQNLTEGESSATSRPLLDPEIVVSALAQATSVREITGKDSSSLVGRFAGGWSVETALKDSVERYSSANIRPARDAHFDVANVLMSMNNSSYQSLGRPQSRAVDVTDLREALGGRTDTITSSAPPSITSTTGTRTIRDSPSQSPGARRKHANPDVKEVLKEIFKDKKRNSAGGSIKRNGPPVSSSTVVAGTA